MANKNRGDKRGNKTRRFERHLQEFVDSGKESEVILGSFTDRTLRSVRKIVDANDYPVEVVLDWYKKMIFFRKEG